MNAVTLNNPVIFLNIKALFDVIENILSLWLTEIHDQ